jgi:hypothetical protein
MKQWPLISPIAASALAAVAIGCGAVPGPDLGGDIAAEPFAGGLLGGVEALEEHVQASATPKDAIRPRSRPRPPGAHVAAVLKPGASATAYDAPGGQPLGSLDSRTEFGSPRVLPIVRRDGSWLRVLVDVAGRRTAWLRWSPGALELRPLRFEIVAERSRRTLTLLYDGRVARRMDVRFGRPGSETPLGRFAVTDKLSGAPYAGAYGCCIVALSGRQTRLPAGWTGGDRLAIHATQRAEPADSGSAGCIVGSDAAIEYLMLRVPVGTVVTVRR